MRGAGNVVTRATAPFAGKVNPEVVAAAERQGVEMPAGAVSTSKIVPVAESVAAKSLGGGKAAARYDAATSALTVQADHLVNRASKLLDDSARGEAISNGFESYKADWMKRKNALYKQAELPERMDLFVRPQQTVALLDEVIANKRAAGRVMGGTAPQDLQFYENLREGLTKPAKGGRAGARAIKDIQARDLLQAQRELNQRIQGAFADPFAAANKGLLKKLNATLGGEIDDGIRAADPQLGAKIDAAKAAYSDGVNKINSTFGKDIYKNARQGKYDLIAQKVLKPSMSVDDIPRIMEVAGPEGTEAMRASTLADIVSKAKNPAGQLTPQGLAREVKRFGPERLGAILTSEQLSTLDDLSRLSQSLERGQKIMNGSQTAFLGRMSFYGGAAFANPALALKAVLGEAAFGKFIGSEVGQKWLTTGYRPFSGASGVAVARGAGASARAGQAASTLSSRPSAPARPPIAFPRAADDDDPYGDRVATNYGGR